MSEAMLSIMTQSWLWGSQIKVKNIILIKIWLKWHVNWRHMKSGPEYPFLLEKWKIYWISSQLTFISALLLFLDKFKQSDVNRPFLLSKENISSFKILLEKTHLAIQSPMQDILYNTRVGFLFVLYFLHFLYFR